MLTLVEWLSSSVRRKRTGINASKLRLLLCTASLLAAKVCGDLSPSRACVERLRAAQRRSRLASAGRAGEEQRGLRVRSTISRAQRGPREGA